MRILLVEDDAMIGRALDQMLANAGYTVDWVRDARAAGFALREPFYELALLDLGLPRGDGLDVLRALRARSATPPVIILTARDAVGTRIAGLDAGADDYLLKPFDFGELLARMRAVLRRGSPAGTAELRHGDLVLDLAAHSATFAGRPLSLSAREYALLEVLARHPDAFLSTRQLQEALYGWDDDISSNVVEVYLHRLRAKMGAGSIVNRRGVGYRLADAPGTPS